LYGLTPHANTFIAEKKSATSFGSHAFLFSLELDLEVETSFHAAGANFDARAIGNTSPLEVWVNAAIATRVIFCRTDRVAVFTNNF